MTYCATCLCHIEPSTDPRQGWAHACRHRHVDHVPPAAISEAQRAIRLGRLRESVAIEVS